jgi:hypothetical protein
MGPGSGHSSLNVLAVTGPQRGRIWYDCRFHGTVSLEPTGRAFFDRYENWLDEWLAPAAIDR